MTWFQEYCQTGNYLSAEHLQTDPGVYRRVTVTIASCEQETLTDRQGRQEIKPVLHFQYTDKALPLNKTNAKQLATLFGTDPLRFAGKKVTLYVDTATGMGPGIRIAVADDGQPTAAAQEAPPPAQQTRLPGTPQRGQISYHADDETPF